MHKRIRFARGSEAARKSSSIVPSEGMPVFAKDANLLYVGDGVSPLSALTPIGSSKLVSSSVNGYMPITTTDKKLVYFNNGTPVESSQTVGSTTKLMYLNSGTFMESNQTVGSSSQPVYLSGGTITAITGPIPVSLGGTGVSNSSTEANITAKIANYASSDTSKGTIEQRLTNLGFREGSISLASGVTASTNSLKRQGNYVIGTLIISNRISVAANSQVTLGSIPLNFRPKENIKITLASFESNLYVEATGWGSSSYSENRTQYGPYIEIKPDGNIILTGPSGQHYITETKSGVTVAAIENMHDLVSGSFYFGYEANPIINS